MTAKSSDRYGEPPHAVAEFVPSWDEFMHYLYLPILMPETETCSTCDGEAQMGFRIPERLAFAREAVDLACIDYCMMLGGDLNDTYVYLTARRGYATPDNPINRPGWHCDGFGTDDMNYVWCDRWPTEVAVQNFGEISPDHIVSVAEFKSRIHPPSVREINPFTLYRFTPFVVHAAPYASVPSRGGMRSFLKISFSKHRYNLVGNSHNYLFDYEWKMYDRELIRNDPHYAGGDYYR